MPLARPTTSRVGLGKITLVLALVEKSDGRGGDTGGGYGGDGGECNASGVMGSAVVVVGVRYTHVPQTRWQLPGGAGWARPVEMGVARWLARPTGIGVGVGVGVGGDVMGWDGRRDRRWVDGGSMCRGGAYGDARARAGKEWMRLCAAGGWAIEPGRGWIDGGARVRRSRGPVAHSSGTWAPSGD